MSETIRNMLGFSVQIAEEYRAEKELAEAKIEDLEKKLAIAVEALKKIEDLPPLNEFERKVISREALAKIARQN